jgi:hypothetical protein
MGKSREPVIVMPVFKAILVYTGHNEGFREVYSTTTRLQAAS